MSATTDDHQAYTNVRWWCDVQIDWSQAVPQDGCCPRCDAYPLRYDEKDQINVCPRCGIEMDVKPRMLKALLRRR